jgi:preprotein translocase subunit SecB
MGEEDQQKVLKPIYLLPFDVQLENTFCIEIVARRFPEIGSMPHINVSLENAQVDRGSSKAQVVLNFQTISNHDNDEPVPFEISFKIIGIFTYTQNYTEKEVLTFLEQGSLSILLPFARELLINTCTRLQVPPMMLTMVQLAPPPSLDNQSGDVNDK